MKNTYLLIFLFTVLTGCDSDIDRCAKAWQRDYQKTEAEARYICMKVANPPKDN